MIRKYLTSLVLGSIVLLLCACNKDFLNPDNPGEITDEDVWKDENLIRMYVNSLYNTRGGYDYLNTLDNITDEGRNNYPQYAPNLILAGQWDQISNPMDIWGGAYEGIRKANEFFARIDEAPVEEQAKTEMKGEARFLRAFLYFDLLKRYGGVPLIEHAQSLEEDLEVSRNTLDECFAFVDRELSLAAEELPVSVPRGRASKGAATALRGRLALYYASPFYNEGQDNERWKNAADINRSIIIDGGYSLYPDLNRLWLEKGANPEAVFEVQYRLPEKQHSWDSGLKPLIFANDNAGQLSPLQELVNAFPMKNGKLIAEAGSSYDEGHPYEGRDDRFYAFIAYNGSKMKGTNSGPPVKETTLQIYQGGRDYDADPTAKIYNTITGYYTRKAINPENTEYIGNRGSDQPWIEIRYAEVLLNYAEAQNEYLASPDASVYEAVNAIRARAGITSPLVMGSLNKDAMRSLIRNERYVELCFEQKRYWDIRRWNLADEMLNGKRYTGVFIKRQADGSFTYEYIPVDARPNVFTPAMKFMPIPQQEITKNRNLEQNEGWD
ncbi:RagB/SusD family nutrient uptake outer membrane protein [Olivibacter ginsenosidimutans]|uniref:RagB/SusD family nutrient uptake outer membrane protein n=1 Tax=Olivibacter ginsenosidimutans TaxID=1176537 RepID=A0ABP9BUI5_9SPHI